MIFQIGLEEVLGWQKIRKKENKKPPKPNKKANKKKKKREGIPGPCNSKSRAIESEKHRVHFGNIK